MIKLVARIALLSTITGCSAFPPDPPRVNPVRPGLTAVVSPGSRPNSVIVTYRNDTQAEIVEKAQLLETSVLALEVIDVNGRIIAPVPPSPPWVVDPGVRIPAGGVCRVEYEVNQMFQKPLPAGKYRIRPRLWAGETFRYTAVPEQ